MEEHEHQGEPVVRAERVRHREAGDGEARDEEHPALADPVGERSGPFGEGGARAEGPSLFFFSLEPGERRSLAFPLRVERRGVYPLEGYQDVPAQDFVP